jgi:hypothetical protein
MTTSIELFTVDGINLATYLVCLGFNLNILPPATGTRALFEFVMSPELAKAIIGYERRGNTAKTLLDTRGRLYKESSAIVRGGGS